MSWPEVVSRETSILVGHQSLGIGIIDPWRSKRSIVYFLQRMNICPKYKEGINYRQCIVHQNSFRYLSQVFYLLNSTRGRTESMKFIPKTTCS